eukprot:SAG11_NODE_10174_length_849_cov_11.714667_1_plen_207_part_01
MEQKYCSMEQKYCSILFARAYPILTVADGSEQLAGWHSRSGSGNLCHGDRSRTGSYPLWVGNRFSIGPEPDEASRVPARGSESLLSAAGEPQPTSHAQQQRALSLPRSPHYHSLRKLLSKHVCFHSLATGLFLRSASTSTRSTATAAPGGAASDAPAAAGPPASSPGPPAAPASLRHFVVVLTGIPCSGKSTLHTQLITTYMEASYN